MGKNTQYALLMMAVGGLVVWLLGRECSRRATSVDAHPAARQRTLEEPAVDEAPCLWQGHPCSTAFDYSNACYINIKAKRFATARALCSEGEGLEATDEVRAMLFYNLALVECHEGKIDAARTRFGDSLTLRPAGPGADTVRKAQALLESGTCLE